MFHNTLVELGLLAATVIALAVAIWVLRHCTHRRRPQPKTSATVIRAVRARSREHSGSSSRD
ncbi:MAG: hypothetical protein ABI591_03495 [Kofleriaceae bacterium]